jgi:hypothetical protein
MISPGVHRATANSPSATARADSKMGPVGNPNMIQNLRSDRKAADGMTP